MKSSMKSYGILLLLTFLPAGRSISQFSLAADTAGLTKAMFSSDFVIAGGHEVGSPLVIDEAVKEKKSVFLAVMYSILLPGMGELYAGRMDRGVYPLVTEGALWLGFAGFNAYGGWVKDDARSFALQHAFLRDLAKDDDFFVAIASYDNIDDYNSRQLVERNLSAVYSGEKYQSMYWSWDNWQNRLKYKDQRIHSDQMFNAARFVVFGLVANRVWSAVESAMFVKRHNASLTSGLPSIRSRLLTRQFSVDGVELVMTMGF
jgi:hypothetical protein